MRKRDITITPLYVTCTSVQTAVLHAYVPPEWNIAAVADRDVELRLSMAELDALIGRLQRSRETMVLKRQQAGLS